MRAETPFHLSQDDRTLTGATLALCDKSSVIAAALEYVADRESHYEPEIENKQAKAGLWAILSTIGLAVEHNASQINEIAREGEDNA